MIPPPKHAVGRDRQLFPSYALACSLCVRGRCSATSGSEQRRVTGTSNRIEGPRSLRTHLLAAQGRRL
eukprot:13334408-Alexandrium_andersonii.AAC.1